MKRSMIVVAGLLAASALIGCAAQKAEVKPAAANMPSVSEDAKSQQRITELEDYTKKLETDLSNKQAELDRMSKAGADKSVIKKLSDENAVLADQIKRLKAADRAENDLLMKKAYRGDIVYNDLKEKMKDEIASGDINLDIGNDSITVYIKERIFFDSGEAAIKPSGESFLHKIAPVLSKLSGKVIRIEGHTDNVPIAPDLRMKYPSNWELGAARAINVVRYLQDKEGLDPTGLSAISYGEYRPIDSNNTPEGKTKNRRIQIVIVDKEPYKLGEMGNQ